MTQFVPSIRMQGFLFGSLSGLLTAYAYIEQRAWGLAFVSLVPLIFFILKTPRKQLRHCLATTVFSYSILYYGPVLYWLYYLTPVIPLDGILPKLAVTAAIGFIIVQNALAIWIVFQPLKYMKQGRAVTILTFACLYILAEWMQQNFGLITFPWTKLGLSVTRATTFIQSASLFGCLFISFLLLLSNGLIAYTIWLLIALKKKKAIFVKKNSLIALVAVVVLLAGNWVFGVMSYRKEQQIQAQEDIEILLVQGNHSGLNKWVTTTEQILEDYINLTKKAITPQTKLVIWPETAVPVNLKQDMVMQSRLINLCKEYQVEMIVGAFDKSYIEEELISYNAMYLITEAGIVGEPYYKQKLVPFGEYLPFEKTLKKVAPSLVEMLKEQLSDTPGNTTVLMSTSQGLVGGIICYESIYSGIARDSVKQGAKMLALISNDSWFGYSAALSQHHSQAIMRAVENRRYVVRASNTGITSIITSSGEVSEIIPVEQAATIHGTIAMRSDLSLYTQIGDIIIIPCVLLWFFGIFKSKYCQH